MMLSTCSRALVGVALLASAVAQTTADPIQEARVREVVSWLAADERGGRDSPSPGQAAAAQWLGEQFQAAGLQQIVENSWLHGYTLPGVRLDSTAIQVKITRREGEAAPSVTLTPDQDVRLLRPADAIEGHAEEATVVPAGDPRALDLLMSPGGRRPIIVEVPTDHPLWLKAAGVHEQLGGRRAAARPVFLVRAGLLPAGKDFERASWTIDWSAPKPVATDVALHNVVGVLRGGSRPDEWVVVTAHYDHIGMVAPVKGDAIANGADDDASGTTAVVLLAEALARMPRPARSVAFVCFSAEEKGLRGSRAFAQNPPFPLDRIVANVNIEMIGRPEEGRRHKAWITGAELSDFATMAGTAMGRAGVELVEFKMARQLFAASDNLSFAREGVVAHSISAGSLHADYHQPGDEVGKLDLEHMTTIIRALREFVRDLADGEARPAYNEAGKEAIDKLKRRG